MIPRASRFLELDTPLNGARTPSAWANREEFFTRLRFLAGENTEQLAERWFLADRDVNALPDEPVTLVVATLMRLVASLLFPEWLSPGEGRADKSFIQDFFARTWRQQSSSHKRPNSVSDDNLSLLVKVPCPAQCAKAPLARAPHFERIFPDVL